MSCKELHMVQGCQAANQDMHLSLASGALFAELCVLWQQQLVLVPHRYQPPTLILKIAPPPLQLSQQHLRSPSLSWLPLATATSALGLTWDSVTSFS